MAGCTDDSCVSTELADRQRRILIWVLLINAVMFVVEASAGWLANSSALLADSLDMLGDAIAYGFSLYVIARGPRWTAISALLKGSIMALFGFPTEQPDDAIRAVRAALGIQTNVAAYAHDLKQRKDVEFSVRVGLDTGVVTVGEISGDQRTEYTALGDPVNIAQRLEGAADPGTVVISHRTFQLVRDWFTTESLGPVRVKGKSAPVKAYRVLGERTDNPEKF